MTTGGVSGVEREGLETDDGGLDLDWDLRIVLGVAKTEEGLRRVGGAILTVEDQTFEVGLFDCCFFSSSVVDDGGGRSPYNPPNIVVIIWGN